MNALGAPLDGEAMGYLGRGSLASGPYGVDNKGGAKPVMCECSRIGANGDHDKMWQGTLKGVASVRGPPTWKRSSLWWLDDTLDTKEMFRLIPSHLD